MNNKLTEYKKYIKSKKVAILGIGISNAPLIRYLAQLGVDITAFDRAEAVKLADVLENMKDLDVKYSLGHDYLERLKDFDIIFIGEMRDLESIDVALDIAEAGHLVFATINSSNAYLTPDSIINSFPPYYQSQARNQLANVLKGIIAQKLLPKVDGGRIPAIEVLIANQAVKNIIREGKTQQLKNIIETSQKEGMTTFEQSAEKLVAEGKVIPEIARKIIG